MARLNLVGLMARGSRSREASADEQTEVTCFLGDPSSFGPGVDRVERIETHGAIVFLAGDRAYKLKRAVRLPYLDFSTVAKREAVCRHEFERNAAAAPTIYIGVEAITRSPDGGLGIGGSGTPVDWVVVMHRFAQDFVLDQLASRGELQTTLMVSLAMQISDSHARAQSSRGGHGARSLDQVISNTIRALGQAADTLGTDRIHRYSSKIVGALNRHSRLLDLRAQKGFVRICHGDLHLRNIVLIDGRPILFDAIEFDDNLATVDVLYDLAFLLMDLWHRDLHTHANLCFNEYLSRAATTDALGGLAALPLFLATRAAVRAMVALDKRAVKSGSPDADVNAEIDEYFSLALSLLEPSRPMLIAVGGYSGTGKSVLARQLAPLVGSAPGAVHLRSDVERKRMLGVEPLDRLPKQAYSEAQSDAVYRRLCARAEAALNSGRSVIVDAAFLRVRQRQWIERVATRTATPFHGLWLVAPTEVLMKRVAKRQADASDADARVVAAQLATADAASSWRSIDASADVDTVLSRARNILLLDEDRYDCCGY